MGRQTQLYLLPEDELSFLEFVMSNPHVEMIKEMSPQSIEKLSIEQLKNLELIKVLFWNKTFGSLEPFVRVSKRKKYDESLGLFIETGEINFWIEQLNAPVIEYFRSNFRDSGELSSGRIWAEMYRSIESGLIPKEEGFKNWYDEIYKWIKRNMIRVKGVDGYLGKEANKWYQAGGLLY